MCHKGGREITLLTRSSHWNGILQGPREVRGAMECWRGTVSSGNMDESQKQVRNVAVLREWREETVSHVIGKMSGRAHIPHDQCYELAIGWCGLSNFCLYLYYSCGLEPYKKYPQMCRHLFYESRCHCQGHSALASTEWLSTVQLSQ